MMMLTQKTPRIERIRGSNLAVFIRSYNGAPMEEALRRADEAGLIIASNKRLSRALVGSGEWRSLNGAFKCWSGTMAAYGKPDHVIGKTIEYTDSETGIRYVFPVPEEHSGKKNVVLIAEHPDFRLVTDGNTRVVQAKEVGIVSDFPPRPPPLFGNCENWYLGDPKFDIPTGMRVYRSIAGAMRLRRIDRYVGLVARGDDWDGDERWSVAMFHSAATPLGVAVEAPESAATTQIPVRQDDGKLIVEGTPEQIAAAARLLEQLKVK